MRKIARGNSVILLILSLGAVLGCQKAPDSTARPAKQAPVAAVQPPSFPVAEKPALATTANAPTIGASSAAATGTSAQTPILRAVRVGTHPGVDRIVFEFDTANLPAWHAEYVDRPVRDCGSGDAVPVAGDAWLQIRFTGAQAHTEQGESTSGPRRRALSQTIARELVRTCDFEGEVTWVVGVARPNPYTARALSAPARLVIDISH